MRWHYRMRERARANRATDLVWRLSVFALGSAILVAGLIMLLLPGPGWAAIFVGLAILSTEFGWASRLLARARALARRAADRARDPRARRRNLLVVSASGLLVAVLGAAYLARYGVTLDGPRNWVQAVR